MLYLMCNKINRVTYWLNRQNINKIVLTISPNVLAAKKTITTIPTDKQIAECYKALNIPMDSKQDVVRKAFLELAKKYHPDSESPEADVDKFVVVENAFRILSKHNTGVSNKEEVEKIVYDIRHTAPQHRQYLSYGGYGHGNIFQREKQYMQAKAQRAAINVMEHKLEKALASENTLMVKGQHNKGKYNKKHDIKTRYGFDRLVEDLIQESMSKGEFENLSGKGKPLKDQNSNPYVDFTTHKLNEVLINNGFTPEWITMGKEIDVDIENLKQEIRLDRMPLGPYPLCDDDFAKWEKIKESKRDLTKSINSKINTYNLIVPLLNKQKFHVEFDNICEDILKTGIHSVVKIHDEDGSSRVEIRNSSDDLFAAIFKLFGDLINFNGKKKH